MTDYGFDLTEYANRIDKCTDSLANYLNRGKLGLFLGAGVSYALELPCWEVLVKRAIEVVVPGTTVSSDINELKRLSSLIKSSSANQAAYLELIKKKLYEKTPFDFKLASKEMLIALTSLMVGKVRGNVKNVVTLNFDSVIEWYLKVNGLNANVVTKNHLAESLSDIDILHLHGYLPHDATLGFSSDEIVFTKEEFEDRERGLSYWKDLMNDFYRRHVFLAIGVSPDSICDDVAPYLRVHNKDWYDIQGVSRKHPYGVAILTRATTEQQNTMISAGIIPCVISDKDKIPPAIFEIAQKATAKTKLH